MLVLTREMLVQRLLEVPALTDAYVGHEPWFDERLAAWIKAVEDVLVRLRHPASGHIAVERSKLSAAAAGYHDTVAQGRRPNRREDARAAALSIMYEVESAVQQIVADTDSRLDAHKEKVVQLLAVASVTTPLPLQGGLTRESWLKKIWESVGANEETRGMYNYLQATATRNDLHALIGEVMQNVLPASPGDVHDQPGDPRKS